MTANPYQPFFDKLDATIVALEADPAGAGPEIRDAVDLLRRSGFALANLLNTFAVASPHLILPVEGVVVDEEPSKTMQ